MAPPLPSGEVLPVKKGDKTLWHPFIGMHMPTDAYRERQEKYALSLPALHSIGPAGGNKRNCVCPQTIETEFASGPFATSEAPAMR